MSMDIFRKYDIRGIYNKDLTDAIAYKIGLALGNKITSKKNNDLRIVIAKDARLSGNSLAKNLTNGLIDAGIDVYDIGTAPTPVLYHYVAHQKFAHGVMITGSHNPSEYNGMKIIINNVSFFGEDLNNLAKSIHEDTLSKSNTKGNIFHKKDAIDNYENDIISKILSNESKKTALSKIKVVIDSGNGVAGIVAPSLLRKLGCEVIDLYSKPDGSFPNHHPDPAKLENLKDLQAQVLKNHADLGLAFDGDADRLGVITNKAEVIWPDRVLMLFAVDVLKKYPKATIVYDVKCCRHLEKVIIKNNGIPLMYCTGHSLIKSKIKESGALLAGEMSGHIFFKDDWYGFDDGIYSAVRLLDFYANIKETQGISFSELMEKYDDKSITTPEINIATTESKKHSIISDLAKHGEFGDCKKIDIDGLRIEYTCGWGLVRASNTTPNLVLRFEAQNQDAIDKIQDTFKKEIAKVAPEINW